jgi:hypothetical protein
LFTSVTGQRLALIRPLFTSVTGPRLALIFKDLCLQVRLGRD